MLSRFSAKMERIEGDDPSGDEIESSSPSKYALRFVIFFLYDLNQTSFL